MIKSSTALKAGIFAAVLIALAIVGFLATKSGNGAVKRIFVLLGGDFIGGGYIQFGTYLAFFPLNHRLSKIYQKRTSNLS